MKKIFFAVLSLLLVFPVCADFTATDSQNLADITADMDYVYSNVASIKRWVDIIKANLHGLIVDGNLLQRVQWIERYLHEIDETSDTYLPDIYDALVGIDSDVAAPLADVVSTLSDIYDSLSGFETDLSLLANLSYLSTIHQDISDLHVTTVDGFATTYNQLYDILSAVNGISFDDQVTALNNIAQTLSGLASDLQNGDVPVSDDLAGVIEDAISNALHDWNPTVDVGGGTIDANVDFSEFDYSYFVSADDFAGLRSDVTDIRNDVNSIEQYLTLPNYSFDYYNWAWSASPGLGMRFDSGQKVRRTFSNVDFFSAAISAYQGMLNQGDSINDSLRQLIYLSSVSTNGNDFNSGHYDLYANYSTWNGEWPLDKVTEDDVYFTSTDHRDLGFKDMVYHALDTLMRQGHSRERSLLQLVWSLQGTNDDSAAVFQGYTDTIDSEAGELDNFKYFTDDPDIAAKWGAPDVLKKISSNYATAASLWRGVDAENMPTRFYLDFGHWGLQGVTGRQLTTFLDFSEVGNGHLNTFFASLRKAAQIAWWFLFIAVVYWIFRCVLAFVYWINHPILKQPALPGFRFG